MHARAKELGLLYAITDELNATSDVREALERMLAVLTRLLKLRSGWIWLLDPETDHFYNAAAHDLPPYLRDPVRMAGTWCHCTQAFRDGRLAPQNVDVFECSRLAPAVAGRLTKLTGGLRYHASVPLHFRGKALGIMNLTGPKWRRLSRGELRLLSTVALQAGAMIERARLADESERLARIEERTRLARDIHDTLAQRLTAIALQLEVALKHLDAAAPARGEVMRAVDIAREGIGEARRSVLTLRGAPPEGKPLHSALEALGRAFTSRTGVPVHVGAAAVDLPASSEAELLAIAQEALTNVGKHARATAVDVTLMKRDGSVLLRVHDDGVGYRRGAAGRGDHHGVVGMRERAALIGAAFSITGSRSAGTTVAVGVPLKRSR